MPSSVDRAWRRPKNLQAGRTVLSVTLGSTREAPPVSERDSSVGAGAFREDQVRSGASLRMTVIVHTTHAREEGYEGVSVWIGRGSAWRRRCRYWRMRL